MNSKNNKLKKKKHAKTERYRYANKRNRNEFIQASTQESTKGIPREGRMMTEEEEEVVDEKNLLQT